jgi:hypothetical protein
MITVNGKTYFTIAESMERLTGLGLELSERTFRQRVRLSGAYLEHRKQLFLTEADLEAVIATFRAGAALPAPRKSTPRPRTAAPCPSSSSAARARKTSTSRVPSAASVTSRALALARASTPKRSA